MHFNQFADSGLEIQVYIYLRVADYETELNERETILLGILDLAAELGVDFAFPTRTLHFDGSPGEIPATHPPSV